MCPRRILAKRQKTKCVLETLCDVVFTDYRHGPHILKLQTDRRYWNIIVTDTDHTLVDMLLRRRRSWAMSLRETQITTVLRDVYSHNLRLAVSSSKFTSRTELIWRQSVQTVWLVKLDQAQWKSYVSRWDNLEELAVWDWANLELVWWDWANREELVWWEWSMQKGVS